MQSKKRSIGCTEECTRTGEVAGDRAKVTTLKRRIDNSDVSDSNSFSRSKAQPTHTIKPFHVRLKEYREAKERIFGSKRVASRSANRMCQFWKKVRSFKMNCISSVLDKPSDVRPYAEVTLFGEKFLGLLDTGASLSCIGSKFV